MKTAFDFASVLLFAVLAVIYLNRSAKDQPDPVPLWAYAATALALAAGDVIANRGHRLIGTVLLAAAVAATLWIFMRKEAPPRASH